METAVPISSSVESEKEDSATVTEQTSLLLRNDSTTQYASDGETNVNVSPSVRVLTELLLIN